MTRRTPTLRGMTWSHPRATAPLAAFAAAHPELPAVQWDSQPLAAFEARPISGLAREYDLLVIDHPGIGAAVAAGALQPLGQLFSGRQLSDWERAAVGPTWSSYHYQGEQWAVPIDSATQVSVLGTEIVEPAPTRWDEVPAFAARHRTTLCLGGPHAGLMFLAIAASASALGAQVDPVIGVEALELLQSLWPLVDQSTSLLDPIGVHAAVAGPAGPDYCPLAYGYANYAPAVHWSDAPSWKGGPPASVLGGTGLAVSARTGADPDELRRYVTGYLAAAVQNELVPAAGGQPATAAAWADPEVDRAAGGYYSGTIRSIRTAWIRPRRPGWIAAQDQISEIVRETMISGGEPVRAIGRINVALAAQEVRV